MPAVLVSHPQLIEQVLVSRNKQFSKSIDMREMRLLLGDGLLTSEGEIWRRCRRAMQPAFHQKQMAGYCQTMQTVAEQVSEDWHDGEERELRQEMTRLTLRAVTEALFGTSVVGHESEVGEAINALFRLFDFTSATAYLLPNYLPTPLHLRALGAMRRLGRLIDKIFAERRTKPRAEQDLLDMLGQLPDAHGARGRKLVRNQVMTLLVAGHETTSAALAWCWYLLTQNPDVERKFHAELDTVLGGRPAGSEDLPRLAYTGQIFTETLRLYPPAWMIAREATVDTEIGGYAVPKRTAVYLSPWVVHRDPRFYPEPERFNPDRWTEDFSRQLPSYAYFPFGGGPRMCIGASFARTEAILALATIGQRFRFTLQREPPIRPRPSVTLRPQGRLPVIVHRRFPELHAGGPSSTARQAGAATP